MATDYSTLKISIGDALKAFAGYQFRYTRSPVLELLFALMLAVIPRVVRDHCLHIHVGLTCAFATGRRGARVAKKVVASQYWRHTVGGTAFVTLRIGCRIVTGLPNRLWEHGKLGDWRGGVVRPLSATCESIPVADQSEYFYITCFFFLFSTTPGSWL